MKKSKISVLNLNVSLRSCRKGFQAGMLQYNSKTGFSVESMTRCVTVCDFCIHRMIALVVSC